MDKHKSKAHEEEQVNAVNSHQGNQILMEEEGERGQENFLEGLPDYMFDKGALSHMEKLKDIKREASDKVIEAERKEQRPEAEAGDE